MCVLDISKGCGGSDRALFIPPQIWASLILNNVERCPAMSLPQQHPLNCVNFRIRHGVLRYAMKNCAACTHEMKRRPPLAMRQVPLPLPFTPVNNVDVPPAACPSLARTQNNSMFNPNLSKRPPSYAEADAATAANPAAAAEREQVGLNQFANHPASQLNPASLAAMPQAPPQKIDLSQLGPTSVQNTPAHRPAQAQRLSSPAQRLATLTLRPSAQPLSDIPNINHEVAELQKLLKEQRDLVAAVSKENEDLKKEIANFKDLAKN